MRRIVMGAAVVLVACGGLGGASAQGVRTVSVPGDYETIREAIRAVGDDAVIEVGPGVYGPIVVEGRWDVTLRGPSDAIVDGGGDPAISVTRSRRVVVEGFTVISATDGVQLTGGSDLVVRDVTVMSAGDDGISVSVVEDVVVTGNRIEFATDRGIDIDASAGEVIGALTVTSNTIFEAGGDAINVSNRGDGAHTEISRNIVQSAGGRGVVAECGLRLEVTHNDIRRTNGTAIVATRIYGPCIVADNDVTGCGGSGIDAGDSIKTYVRDNRVESVGGEGISVTGNHLRVVDNTVTGTSGAGIHAWEAPNPFGVPRTDGPDEAVSSNVVSTTGGDGIVLDGTYGIEVTGNAVIDAGVHGIHLERGANGVRLKSNRVTGASGCGFRLAQNTRDNVLTRNRARDCGRDIEDAAEDRANRILRSNRFARVPNER